MASKQHILRALCSHLLVLFSVFMGDSLSSQSTSGFLFFENKLSVWKFNKKQRICSQFHHVHKVVLHIFIKFTLRNFLSSFSRFYLTHLGKLFTCWSIMACGFDYYAVQMTQESIKIEVSIRISPQKFSWPCPFIVLCPPWSGASCLISKVMFLEI